MEKINLKQTARNILFLIFFFNTCLLISQNDKEGCKDHPILPSRIPDYYIGNCEINDFSVHTLLTKQGDKTIEGKKTVIEYFLKEGGKGVSETFVCKNYMEAIKKLGAKIEHESINRGVGVIKQSSGTTYWVDVTGYVGDGSPEQTGHYYLTIIELAPMEQVISAKTIGDELKLSGRSVLYIQFESGKSVIMQESKKIIEQMADYLKSNNNLKVFIVGHTDNNGSLEFNLQLSEQRALAVVKELINVYKVSSGQLTSKGVGQLAPVASNTSEDGKKLNRRVEMVLQ